MTLFPPLRGAAALLASVAVPILFGIIGALVDLLAGTRGWWIALGSLGLCFGALLLAALSVRPTKSRPAARRLQPAERSQDQRA